MRRALPAALAALALAACNARETSDEAFGQRVRAYLLAHPEILQEVSQKAQADEEARSAAAMKKAEGQLPELRAAIEHDPRDFVANPRGRITVTEFYDYRCPHCIAMAPKLLALIRTRPEIRLVFKEMPIFGATSDHAAYAALAVKKAGGDYLGLYQAQMAAQPLDDKAIDAMAEAHGARAGDIPPNAANTAQLAATNALFTRLGMDGTPGFVVGDHILEGDDMTALGAAIEAARKSAGG